jgi:AcrR family transcriptional regulator
MFGKGAATGAAARRERGREEMRAAIIEASRPIIIDQGIDALTIRFVAQQLGYSPGALYEYFASKEAILIALYFESQDGMDMFCEQAVRELPENATPVDALWTLGHAYRRHALAHAELYRMAFGEFKTPPVPASPDPDHARAGAFGTLIRIAEQGIRDGVFIDDASPLDIAFVAWSTVHGFVSLEVTGRIAGGDGPGVPPASPNEGKSRRDDLFDTLTWVLLSGLVRKEHHHLIMTVSSSSI